MSKSTIYIDIEDEITTIIDKLKEAPETVVAVVLPKRASVLQSIVNLKLLKRAAEQSHKKAVLITSDSSVVALAGSTGMYVAATLQSKPYIPEKVDTTSIVEEVDAEDIEIDTAEESTGADDEDEAASKEAVAPVAAAAAEPVAKALKRHKSKKALKVPNFDKFRLKLLLGGFAAVALLVGWFFAFVVAPKASIIITAERTALPIEESFVADFNATGYNAEAPKTFPAAKKTAKKTFSESFTATGKKDMGSKATGKMTIYNCNKQDQAITVPVGSVFSAGGFSFVTDQAVTVAASNFTGTGTCKKDKTAIVNVTAQQGGDTYNLSARDYTSSIADISGSGTVMSGGTTKIVTVVSAEDAETVSNKLLSAEDDTIKDMLTQELKTDGMVPILDTFEITKGTVVLKPAVDQEATDGTATVEYTYTMAGVSRSALETYITTMLENKIDKAKQVVIDMGVDTAVAKVTQKTATNTTYSFNTTAYAGPSLDAAAIVNEVLGKSLGETESTLRARPGVTEVKIDYEPFWVFSTPKAAKKVNVTFEVPTVSEQE